MATTPRLMTPGPVHVPRRVYEAEASPMIHHRSAEFSSMLREVVAHLRELLGTASNYVFLTPSSGRGSMEAAIANFFSSGDEVIAVANGSFGRMFADIAQAFGLRVHRVFTQWGMEVDEVVLREEVGKHQRAAGLLVCHGETSTAVENPLEIIARVARGFSIPVIVDAVSTLGGMPIDMDRLDLAVVVSASQKCLMAPAGLSILAVSDRMWARAEQSNLPKYYWDVRRMRQFMDKPQPQTPASTPVSLVRAMREALRMIAEEGVPQVFRRHHAVAEAIRAGIGGMGMQLFPAQVRRRCDTVSAVCVPAGHTSGELRRDLLDRHAVFLAGGLGDYGDTTFRIGHMGSFGVGGARLVIRILEEWLEDKGLADLPGSGMAAVEAVLEREGLVGEQAAGLAERGGADA